MARIMTLETNQYGQLSIYLAEWSWYGGKSHGLCLFTTKDEAIKWAIFQAISKADWAIFPDPAKLYPYDDRTSLETPELDPLFRVTWDTEGGGGGGSSQVSRMVVDDKFTAARPWETQAIFDRLARRVPKPSTESVTPLKS